MDISKQRWFSKIYKENIAFSKLIMQIPLMFMEHLLYGRWSYELYMPCLLDLPPKNVNGFLQITWPGSHSHRVRFPN